MTKKLLKDEVSKQELPHDEQVYQIKVLLSLLAQ